MALGWHPSLLEGEWTEVVKEAFECNFYYFNILLYSFHLSTDFTSSNLPKRFAWICLTDNETIYSKMTAIAANTSLNISLSLIPKCHPSPVSTMVSCRLLEFPLQLALISCSQSNFILAPKCNVGSVLPPLNRMSLTFIVWSRMSYRFQASRLSLTCFLLENSRGRFQEIYTDIILRLLFILFVKIKAHVLYCH